MTRIKAVLINALIGLLVTVIWSPIDKLSLAADGSLHTASWEISSNDACVREQPAEQQLISSVHQLMHVVDHATFSGIQSTATLLAHKVPSYGGHFGCTKARACMMGIKKDNDPVFNTICLQRAPEVPRSAMSNISTCEVSLRLLHKALGTSERSSNSC
jgi:hypothetical protein